MNMSMRMSMSMKNSMSKTIKRVENCDVSEVAKTRVPVITFLLQLLWPYNP